MGLRNDSERNDSERNEIDNRQESLHSVERNIIELPLLPKDLKERMGNIKQLNDHHLINGHNTTILEHTALVTKAVKDLYGNNEKLSEEDVKILEAVAQLHDAGKPDVIGIKMDADGKETMTFYKHADKSEEIAKEILETSSFTPEERETIANVVKIHEIIASHDAATSLKAMNKRIRAYGEHAVELALYFREADVKGQNPDKAQEKLDDLNEAWKLYKIATGQ